MKNLNRTMVMMTALTLAAGSVYAEPFVFQGQLNESGAPADGFYDLTFTLYDMESLGGVIGPMITLENQQVTNGNFTVELDFGDAFNGSLRWVETGVREGTSSGAFTTLSPRMKIASAPQASYATRAGSADSITDSFWTRAPGIITFGESEGDDQFFFNTLNAIESTDVIVAHSSAHGPGGMHVSGWTQAMPYYGYATGGFSRAKTYYDPATDAWVVNKGGTDLLEVDQNNDVIITNNLIVQGSITSGDGSGSVLHYESFTPDSLFIGLGTNTVFNTTAGAIVSQGAPNGSYLRADLKPIQGAMISKIEVQYVDANVNPNLQVQLSTRNLSTMGFTQTLLGESTGGNGSNVQTMSITPINQIVIDNTAQTYDLRFVPSNGTWPSSGNLGVRSVLVEYTLP